MIRYRIFCMTEAGMVRTLTEAARTVGAREVGVVSVAQIPFRPEFRDACVQNSCGVYGKCWMCPPDVGEISALIAQARTFSTGLVFQTVGQLEDSFDIEGMQAAARHHNEVCRRLFAVCEKTLRRFLPLGAGGCLYCRPCARISGAPCHFPEKAFSSLEAYGIGVADLAALCDLAYMNGVNTVTYFGAVLFDLEETAT